MIEHRLHLFSIQISSLSNSEGLNFVKESLLRVRQESETDIGLGCLTSDLVLVNLRGEFISMIGLSCLDRFFIYK